MVKGTTQTSQLKRDETEYKVEGDLDPAKLKGTEDVIVESEPAVEEVVDSPTEGLAVYAREVDPGEMRTDGSHARMQDSEGLLSGPKRQVEVDDEEFLVVEGDLLLDADQSQIYMEQQYLRAQGYKLLQRFSHLSDAHLISDAVTPGGHGSSALIGIGREGQLIRWAPGVVLTYCVLMRTFPSEDFYNQVVANMEEATQDWMDTCGVEFKHLRELDSSPSLRPEGTVFPVRFLDTGGQFIAAAFFPTDMKTRWRVLIDPSFLQSRFDPVGVLRHELGHCLGFRHEHIRSGAPAACPKESLDDTVPLGAYDPQSVMHYFCGGVGSSDLKISQVDISGSQLVYGPPLGDFVLLEP